MTWTMPEMITATPRLLHTVDFDFDMAGSHDSENPVELFPYRPCLRRKFNVVVTSCQFCGVPQCNWSWSIPSNGLELNWKCFPVQRNPFHRFGSPGFLNLNNQKNLTSVFQVKPQHRACFFDFTSPLARRLREVAVGRLITSGFSKDFLSASHCVFMINGLYSGASALDIFSRQQELVSSNLAHLNTPGHKRMLFSFQEQSDSSGDKQASRPGTNVDQFVTDFSEGRLEPTGRKLDLAIRGDGFFEYQSNNGKVYSRSGILSRDPTGQLINSDGLPILNDGNPIIIDPAVSELDIVIDESGSIWANGSELGQVSIVAFDDNQLLESQTQTYFRKGEAEMVDTAGAKILQGNRELSNAHPVNELISLIVGSRHHELAQRAIRTISETIQQAIRE